MAGFIACFVTVAVGLIIMGVCSYVFKPREKRVEVGNPLSPTLRWMNTAGSILLAANEGSFYRMAGMIYPGGEDKPERVERIRKMLREYWEIETHDQAMEEMQSLLDTGMRSSYGREMQQLETLCAGCSEEQLIEIARQQNPKADEDSFLPRMLMAYRKYGEDALLGWDMGRAAFIVQCCYFVGYVSMEEVLEIGVEAGKKAQAVFQNWEEMMESYLLGGQYWQRDDRNDPQSMTAERWKLYIKLWKGDNAFRETPYLSIPFDLPLSKEIVTDKYGYMPAYQKKDKQASG